MDSDENGNVLIFSTPTLWEVISSPAQELTFVTGRTKQNGLNEGHKFIISYYNCQVLPSLNKEVLLHSTKGNFPLAECNEMSGKCFSHTPRGSGYRSCDGKAGSCFCCVRHYWPFHPPTLRFQFCRLNVMCNFVICSCPTFLGVCYVYIFMNLEERSAWRSYQWCVRNGIRIHLF